MNYANEWVDDVIATHIDFPFILYTEMTSNPHIVRTMKMLDLALHSSHE